MSGATLCLWTGTTSLTLSGNAVFKVKGIWSNASKNVTVGGSSKLILTGTQGISNNLGSLTMNGGTIEFQESATIAKALTLTSGVESTINIADTKSATISTVALSTVPAVGDKILATNGGTITVSAITAGGVAQELDLSYWSDGVYVAAAEYDSVNYPSVSAAIAVATDAHLADITLLNGCTTVPDGYYIDNGVVTKYPVALVTSGASAYKTDIQSAIIAADQAAGVYDYIEVLVGGNINVPLNILESLRIKNTGGATLAFTGIADDCDYDEDASDPAYTVYTKSNKPTTYTWAGGVEDTFYPGSYMWAEKGNWRYVNNSSETVTASRQPQAGDNVVFNSDATITISAATTIDSITNSCDITLAKSSADVVLTATTGGIVLTDVGASITVSGVALSPRPTTTVANSYVAHDSATGVFSVDTYKELTIVPNNSTVTVATNGVTVAEPSPYKLEAGTVTLTVAPNSGYAVTGVTASSGEVTESNGVYSYTVTQDATITVTTVSTAVTFSEVEFDYYAGYARAKSVSATVTGTPGENTAWTLTVGDVAYTGGVYDSATGKVTWTPENGIANLAAGQALSYSIAATGGSMGTLADQQTTVGNVVDRWIAEDATHSGTGTWSPDAPVFGEAARAALSGETTFTARAQASGKVTLTTVVNFGNEAAPTLEISADAKAAIKVENNSFKIWTKRTSEGGTGATADWLTVSGATPSLEADSTVVFTFDTDAKTFTVSVGGNALYYGASNANTSFAFASDGVAISSVAYKGAGSFTSLTGKYTTTDIAQTVDGKGVVVANSFISGNAALRAMTIEEAAAALAPDATATCSNGYNYFANYALGLDPTKADDKPIVDVTVVDGNYVFTVKHPVYNAQGEIIGYEEIDAADNVSTTVTLKYGTDASSITTVEEGAASGISPADMFERAGAGNVIYYKAEVKIGAK